jgi:hypothetical protein
MLPLLLGGAMTEETKSMESLLIRYFDILSLTPLDMRYSALMQWEEDLKLKIEHQKNSVV